MTERFIIYISKQAEEFDSNTVRDIAIESSRNNHTKGISGILMGVGKYFLQVLEGNEDTLKELLGKIEKDTRHSELQVLYDGEIEQRIFGRWSMGCVDLSTDYSPSTNELGSLKEQFERLCSTQSDESRELLKDLIVQIPKKLEAKEIEIV